MHYNQYLYWLSVQAVPITDIVEKQHIGNRYYCQSDYQYISINHLDFSIEITLSFIKLSLTHQVFVIFKSFFTISIIFCHVALNFLVPDFILCVHKIRCIIFKWLFTTIVQKLSTAAHYFELCMYICGQQLILVSILGMMLSHCDDIGMQRKSSMVNHQIADRL